MLYELLYYMIKMSTAGLHTCLQSFAEVFTSVVNVFLR